MARPAFPFSAIVGQDDMKLALVLNVVAPEIGGVLIQGERGTAKSTAVRALAMLLPEIPYVRGCPLGCDPEEPAAFCPHCRGEPPGEDDLEWRRRPVVDLPLGASEERVLGHLDLEAALSRGVARFTPGLLFQAHRGILYVDEVNLLPDHLVDVLLDVAASGRHRVEREGISAEHPARFTLVGTMNPDEGELRPQLLDRFGLGVAVTAPKDPEARALVVARRLAFDEDPEGFCRAFAEEEEEERRRIARAKEALPQVVFPRELAHRLAELTAASGVAGMRADIVAFRAARALAAYRGHPEVTEEDLETALRLALFHRGGTLPEPPKKANPPSEGGAREAPSDVVGSEGGRRLPDRVDRPRTHLAFPKLPWPAAVRWPSDLEAGGGRHFRLRRSRRGHPSGTSTLREGAGSIAWRETILTALKARGHPSLPLRLLPSDLRLRRREGRARLLLTVLLDASGSMGAWQRMRRTKEALLSLAERVYLDRDRMMVVSFRDEDAFVLLPPTNSVRRTEAVLASLPTGGRTPLARGIAFALTAMEVRRRQNPSLVPALLLVTDGRANAGGPSPERLAQREGERLRRRGIPAVVLWPDDRPDVGGFVGRIACALGASVVALPERRQSAAGPRLVV